MQKKFISGQTPLLKDENGPSRPVKGRTMQKETVEKPEDV